MKIGIIGSMPQEIERIVSGFEADRIHDIAGRSYHEGRFYGADAVVVFSRWGKVAAAMTATALIERFNVDCLLFTGVAGAVSSTLEIGDVVIADRLIQHDFDISSAGNLSKFEIPFLGISYFPVDARLVEIGKQAAEVYLAEHRRNGTVYTGTISSGDQFIAHPGKIEELRNAIPDLLAIEMEGAAIAQVCHEYSVPYLVIRTISDKADHSAAMDFVSFIQNVASHYSHGILRRAIPSIIDLENEKI